MDKLLSQLDKDDIFIGTVMADKSPLEPGVFLIPAGCVDSLAPDVPSGKLARWNGAAFDLEDIPVPIQEPLPVVDQTAADRQRILARISEIDQSKIRPASEIALAMASGISPSAVCVKKLAALEAEAETLRAEKERLES